MGRYWSDRQLDRATPPQALDARGRAVLRAVDGHFAGHPLSGFAIKDPMTCPAEALPALIAEYSMEEFIEPGLPEDVVRRILANRWQLKKYKGYDKGVRLGLDLLGMTADITHWHQMEPKDPANTQKLTINLGDRLFAPSPHVKRPRDLDAATRMIRATKRYSQDIAVAFGFTLKAIAPGARAAGFSLVSDEGTPQVNAAAGATRRTRAALTAHIRNTETTLGLRGQRRAAGALFALMEAV